MDSGTFEEVQEAKDTSHQGGRVSANWLSCFIDLRQLLPQPLLLSNESLSGDIGVVEGRADSPKVTQERRSAYGARLVSALNL